MTSFKYDFNWIHNNFWLHLILSHTDYISINLSYSQMWWMSQSQFDTTTQLSELKNVINQILGHELIQTHLYSHYFKHLTSLIRKGSWNVTDKRKMPSSGAKSLCSWWEIGRLQNSECSLNSCSLMAEGSENKFLLNPIVT